MKFKQIGEYVINPANIAYMEIWLDKEGMSKGTRIVFNSYAACASDLLGHGFEAMYVEIFGLNPIEIMDFINDEPKF